jgi:glycosyltransferase involved in cell wall biosynthesis
VSAEACSTLSEINEKIGISVVIPAYNESPEIAGNVHEVVAYLSAQGCDFEVIVSDDGSTDDTCARVNEVIAEHDCVRLLQNRHRGKGPTVTAGVLAAIKPYVLFADADLATPISELDKLLPHLTSGDYDVVIASREGTEAVRVNEPLMRHIMGRMFNKLIHLILPMGDIEDTQCGFKAFRTEVAHDVFGRLKVYGDVTEFSVPFTGAFDVEVLYIAMLRSYRIRTIPVTWTYFETTRISALRDSYKMARDTWRIRRAHRK